MLQSVKIDCNDRCLSYFLSTLVKDPKKNALEKVGLRLVKANVLFDNWRTQDGVLPYCSARISDPTEGKRTAQIFSTRPHVEVKMHPKEE